MCVVSAVFDQYNPHIPTNWPPVAPPVVKPNTTTITIDPNSISAKDLADLIASFHKAVEAAREFDRLTGQPDCEDPEKAKLEERVAALEEKLRQMGEVVGS